MSEWTARELGIDLIKLMACCLVVANHTIDMSKGVLNCGLMELTVLSIPLFFMVNGYLMFKKQEIGWRYALHKVWRILVVCFLWEFLHAVAYFVYYREMRNFLSSFVLDFFQQGLFFHFWFMGALIFLYLLLPFLHRLFRTNRPGFYGLFGLLGLVCIAVDVVMIASDHRFVLDIPQNLRLWYWLFYFLGGGVVMTNKERLRGLAQRHRGLWIGGVVLVLIILLAWEGLVGSLVSDPFNVEAFYGALPVMAATGGVFLALSQRRPARQSRGLVLLTGTSMGIYIVHPFLLAALKKYIPVFVEGGAVANLGFWVVTLLISGIAAWIIGRIPWIKTLVKL